MPSEEISHLFTYLVDFTYLEKQQACESEEEKFKYIFYQEPHPGLMEENGRPNKFLWPNDVKLWRKEKVDWDLHTHYLPKWQIKNN